MKLYVLAACVLLASSASVAAQGLSSMSWRLKAFGGATWPQNDAVDLSGQFVNSSGGLAQSGQFDFDYSVGYVLGTAVGAEVKPNLSLELEFAFRQADVANTFRVGGNSSSISNSNDGQARSVMVNVLYAFDGMGPGAAWQPYLGGGIGGADVELDVGGFGDGSWNADTLFAYQLMAGVGYRASPDWTLFGEARWFQTESGQFEGFFLQDDSFEATFSTVDLLFGAAYNF